MSEAIVTETASVVLSYDGLNARNHRIDMRRFGHALVGFDHVITYGVVALIERRIARPRERLEFDVVTSYPKAGSVEALGALMTVYQAAQGNLPFLIHVIHDTFPDILWHWVSCAFKILGGRKKEAEPHFERIMEFYEKIHLSEKVDREQERSFVLQVIDRLAPRASAVVTPVGKDSEVLRFKRPGSSRVTEISVPEAQAVKSKEPLQVGDPREMAVRIDGLIKHTNRGSVELPDEPGRFVNVEIRDPLFEQTPNPYISAMNSEETLQVTAVPTFKAGELHKLFVMGLAAKAT